jgi:protocatechuate 3,4-dioxygenase beta subunit
VRAQPENDPHAGFQVFRDDGDATTDAEGRFALRGVPPGSHRIVAEGSHRPARSHVVEVMPGRTTDNVRIVAELGATLVVTVMDSRRAPVAGAEVEVRPAGSNGAHAHALPGQAGRRVRAVRGGGRDVVRIDDGQETHGRGKTDAEGRAEIHGLPAGQLAAHVRHETFAPGASAPVAVPEAGSATAEVVLALGGFVQVEARTTLGEPIASTPFRVESASGVAEDGTTDETGSARVGPLAPGSYTAVLRLPPRPIDLGGGAGVFVGAGMDGQALPKTKTSFEITADSTTTVRLVRPVLAKVAGSIVDADGPVANAKVRLDEEDEPALPFMSGGFSAKANGSGQFSIEGVPPGRYWLRYGREGATMLCREPLEIPEGQVLIERKLTIVTGKVRVLVVDEKGEPVSRARVRLDRGEPAARAGGGGAPRQVEIRMFAISRSDDSGSESQTMSLSGGDTSVLTDVEGVAEIEDVPPDTYRLVVTHAKHARAEQKDVAVLAGTTTDLGRLTMGPGASVRGRVLDAEGRPVSFATVQLTPRGKAGAPADTRPAMQGSFAFDSLAAGDYDLRCAAPLPGGPPKWSEPTAVTLEPGGQQTVDLRLPR